MKRSPLRRKTPLARGRRRPSEQKWSGPWREQVMAASNGRSVVSGEPAEECHHVVARSWLRRHGLAHLIWDPRNGVALTGREHARHTSRIEPLCLSDLPATVFAFCEEHGLLDYLDRHYRKDEGGVR